MLNLYRLLLPAVIGALGLCDSAGGQGKPPAAEARPPASGEEVMFTKMADVERALETPAPDIAFNETPLEQALKTLQERAKVNMLVDWADLENNGVERDKPITLHLRNLPLRVALTEVLRQAGGEEAKLGYRVRDGLLRIASQDTLRHDVVLLDEIRFKDTSLPKVIEFLRSADPGFQVVLAGDPGASPDSFIISELDLRKVSASQVLEALQMAYQRVKVAFTDDDPPVWTVRILYDRGLGPEEITSVFRLREAIDRVQEDMKIEDRVKARGAVLQLLENALRMSPGRPEASAALQLHEATDTLLVRATMQEMRTLSEALQALTPPPSMFGRGGRRGGEEAPEPGREATPPPSETKKTPRPPT